MKRIINVRLPVVLGCAVMTGIALGYLFIYYKISLLWISAVVAVTAVIIILHTVFSKNNRRAIYIFLTALFVIAGAVNCYVRLNNYSKSQLVDGGIYTVSAKVCEKGENLRGEYVILNGASADGNKLNGKIIAYLGDKYGDFCDVGYSVNFTAEINVYDIFPYGKLNYNAQENVKYSCTVLGGMTAKYGFSLFGSIRTAIRKSLYANLDADTASVALAMLTGNTQGVDDGAMSSFRYGGIAHIFAVSGLHIGLVYGLLYFIFKKFRLNKYAVFALCILPVFFYAGVCGFTLSSVRAAVMCAVSALARLTHKKYDGLNSLFLSTILILLLSPVSIFSVGFQLSVCAVGGIILLRKNIVKPFKRFPRKIADALAISLSAQAGTLPVLLVNFGYISGAGLLLNIFILPILSAIYIILFLSVLTATVLPFTAVLLQYSALPLQFVISVFLNAGFENALISGFGAGAFLPVYYAGLLALSDKINIKLLYRLTAVFCAVVVLFSYVMTRTYAPFKGYKIVVSAYYSGGDVLIKSGNQNILIVTENLSPTQAQKLLNEYYANNLSALIILGGEDCVTFLDGFNGNCGGAYVYFENVNLQSYGNVKVNYARNFSLNGINFRFEDGYSLLADFNGVSIAVCAGNYTPFESCDLLISDHTASCDCKYFVSFNERNIRLNVYDYGDFNFKIKDGELKAG